LGEGVERVKQYRFIDNQKTVFPIRVLCRMLSVPESSYFDWDHHGRQIRAVREEADLELVEQIRRVHAESDSTYGAPRIKPGLADGGIVLSKKKIARLMSEHNICGLSGREHSVKTTRRDVGASKIPDLVNRDFQPSEPDVVWYGDITYIWINNSFWYLSTVIDACTKEILGWRFADNMETSLISDALKSAVARRGTSFAGVKFHSDHGSQYTSGEFAKVCKALNVTQSMGRTGICYDNAGAESFFATIKRELIDRYYWDDPKVLHTEIFGWIETWYNRKRKHTSVEMKTPFQAYTNLTAVKAA